MVLRTHNLSKSYGSLKALDNLNLEIEKGNVYGLLGPNGSGKTTTLGIILSILKYDSGSFEWFDGAYGENYRLKIGAILETPNFYPYLQADDNLKIIAKIKGVEQDDFTEELKIVDLLHRRASKFSSYSLGMKQRLAIAATLIGSPEVLIFDEPTNGLDPQGIAEVRNILQRVADSGKTVILASHILNEVEKICSHVCIIKDGRLLATGPVGAILNRDAKLVELSSRNNAELSDMLSQEPWVQSIEEKDGLLLLLVDNDMDIEEINKYAFNHGIAITHLVGRKRRLEEEFLEIVSKA